MSVCVCGGLCEQIVTGRDALQERALTLNPTSNADDKTDEHRKKAGNPFLF